MMEWRVGREKADDMDRSSKARRGAYLAGCWCGTHIRNSTTPRSLASRTMASTPTAIPSAPGPSLGTTTTRFNSFPTAQATDQLRLLQANGTPSFFCHGPVAHKPLLLVRLCGRIMLISDAPTWANNYSMSTSSSYPACL